ncbi:hypothetical protein KBZ94_32470, partial [Streptomyces sp. RM72]|nr:hypothetical protein [Streptomyces sp. RM72]
MPAVVAAQARVAVVQEDLDVGEVLEADGDAFIAGGRGIVHASRPQGIGPQRAAPPVGDHGGWALTPNPEHGLCGLCQRSWFAVEGVLEGDRWSSSEVGVPASGV